MEREFNFEELPEKKQKLIEAARDLFCLHGIRRVTIEEICRKANVSKMTYYKYFNDKADIARAVLDLFFSDGFKVFKDIIEEEISFPQKFEKILLLVTTEIHTAGPSFLEDLMDSKSPLHAYFQDMQKKTTQWTMDFFKEAQKAGYINPDIKISFLLFMLDRVSDLLNHPELVKAMPDIEERANELALQLFHGFARTKQ
jgi:AcrR family transcriptional regulator